MYIHRRESFHKASDVFNQIFFEQDSICVHSSAIQFIKMFPKLDRAITATKIKDLWIFWNLLQLSELPTVRGTRR